MAFEPGIAPKGEPQSFEEYLLRVNPTRAALENLAAQTDETPIIMLNLLRFRPRGDPSVYMMYGKDAAPEVTKTKSYVGFFGMAMHDLNPDFGLSTDWDGIVLPVYRRRAAFLQLQQSPIYQRAIPLRTAGTYSRLLYVLKDGEQSTVIQDLNQSWKPILKSSQSCMLIELGRTRPGVGIASLKTLVSSRMQAMQTYGGELRIHTQAEVPVVSEEPWDFCAMSGFETKSGLSDYLASSAAQGFNSDLGELCQKTLSVVAKSLKIPV